MINTTRLLKVLLLCLSTSVSWFSFCDAQEAPFYTTPDYSRDDPHVTNFCPLHRLVDEGTIVVRNALNGMNISVAIFDYQLNDDGVIDEFNPAIGIRVFDEVAKRGNFKWRDTYGVIKSPSGNATWDDVLYWGLDTYDTFGDYYIQITRRMIQGVRYPIGWFDAGHIMVQLKETNDNNEFNLWASAGPFTPQLWGLLVVTVILSGVVYFALEYIDGQRYNHNRKDIGIGESLYITSIAALGNGVYEPRSAATSTVALSMTFLFTLIIAMYTANSASHLVIDNAVASPVVDLADAVTKGKTFCLWGFGYPIEVTFKREFPNAISIPFNSNEEVLEGLQEGVCEIGIISTAAYETALGDTVLNEDCKLEWIGRGIDSSSGSFPVRDYSTRCASLLRDVINIHLLDMIEDNTLDMIWQRYRSESKTQDCDLLATEEAENTKTSLGVTNLGGAIAIHGIIMFTAFFFSVGRYLLRCNRQKGTLHGTPPSSEDSNESIGDKFNSHPQFKQEDPAVIRNRMIMDAKNILRILDDPGHDPSSC